MPPITDEHTDELEARRLSRKGRRAPSAGSVSTPTSAQTAGAARDLLRGLITDGSRPDGESSVATDPATESSSTATANPQPEGNRAPESAPRTPRAGEAIDDLIRRVKDSAAGAAVDASSSLQQRRPKGTADLSRDATMSRAAARRRASEAKLRGADLVPTANKRRRLMAATGLLVGVTIFLGTLVGGGGTSAPRGIDASMHNSGLVSARRGVLRGVLDAGIVANAAGLRARARRAAASSRAAMVRREAKLRRDRSRARRVRLKRHATVVRRAVATNSAPPSTAVPVTKTYSPAPAPTSTGSATSVTPQPSATNSSRPAGPTSSDPLGGIGACVKGC